MSLYVMFFFDAPSSKWRVYALVALIFCDGVFTFAVRNFRRAADLARSHLTSAALFYAFLIAAYFAIGMGSLGSGKFTWVQLPVLIFLCCIWFRAVTNFNLERGTITASWAITIVQFLMPLFLFSTLLYPRIKSEWGGGQPIDVTFHFTKDSTLYSSQKEKFRLIDENDLGFSSRTQTRTFHPTGRCLRRFILGRSFRYALKLATTVHHWCQLWCQLRL